MKRYTDEQLSRILGAHDAGELERGGCCGFGWGCCGCANQFAYNKCNPWVAANLNRRAATWFDDNYRPTMTPEALLAALEAP